MDKPKGGRGHSAPYETKQMRVPVILEPQLQELIARFRSWLSDAAPGGLGINSPPKLLDKVGDKLVDKFNQDQPASLQSQSATFKKQLKNCWADGKQMEAEVDHLRSQLESCRAIGNRLAYENGRFLAAQQKADATIGELQSQYEKLNHAFVDSKNEAWLNKKSSDHWQRVAGEWEAEIKQLRSQLSDQAAQAEKWYDQAKAAQAEVEELRSRSQLQPAFLKAIALLRDALLLKANAGGAIKREIEKALKLLLLT